MIDSADATASAGGEREPGAQCLNTLRERANGVSTSSVPQVHLQPGGSQWANITRSMIAFPPT